MDHHWARTWSGAVIVLATSGCGPEVATDLETGEIDATRSALESWAKGDFQQILRVNAGETKVRNRCELTIPLSAPTPLTFTASEPMGWGTSPISVGWKGSAVSVPGLSVTECLAYPCEVTAVYRGEWASGTALPCELSADDGTTRRTGTSSGTSMSVLRVLPVHYITRQSVKVGAPGTSIAGMCVLSAQMGAAVAPAHVTDFGVFANGVEVTTAPASIPLVDPWPTAVPSVGFGSLLEGTTASEQLLKHVTPRNEQLDEGDSLRCAGTYGATIATLDTPLFDLNVSRVAEGNGLSLVTGPTGWTCDPSWFGTDGCHCECGIADPDCSPSQCDVNVNPMSDFWITNGPVRGIAPGNDVIYLGGSFTYVGPPTGSFAAIDLASGTPYLTYPRVDGTVRAVAPDGSGGFYIGGDFTRVNGVPRSRVAHITAAGVVDGFIANVDDTVHALEFDEGAVLLGGEFTSVNGIPRSRIAALDPATGAPYPFNAGDVLGTVYAVAIFNGAIVIGGDFVSVGGVPRSNLAALSPVSGVLSWDPGPSDLGTGEPPTVNVLESISNPTYGEVLYVGGAFRGFTCCGAYDRLAAFASGSSTPIPTFQPQPNAPVRALAVGSGPTPPLYVGGDFTGMGGQTRNYLASVDASTGAVLPWGPLANAPVRAVLENAGVVYAGGDFTTIGGLPRGYVAALSASTGVPLSPWPNAEDAVYAIGISALGLHVGGQFNSIGGVTRNRLAALDATTGAATSWNPNANGTVNALAVNGNTVYAGGDFTTIGVQTRNRLAALNTTTGAAQAWNPNAGGTVRALAVSGGTVYAGGAFATVGGQPRSFVASMDASTGALAPWDPTANDQVRSIAVSGSNVYLAGDFTSVGSAPVGRGASVDATTGLFTGWNPNADLPILWLTLSGSTVYAGGDFTSIGGQARMGIAALDAIEGMATPWNPNPNGQVSSIAVSSPTVYVGGNFTTIGGQVRSHLAALDVSTGAATGWNPWTDSLPIALNATGGALYVGGFFNVVNDFPRQGVAIFP